MSEWYPPEGSENDPAWWAALERAAELSRTCEELPTFAPCEFMFMGREDTRGKRIWLYKHVGTRRYLNLDDEGTAYRFVAPDDLDEPGWYVAYPHLRVALDHLQLDVLSTASRYEWCRGCEPCAATVFPESEGTVLL